MRVLVTGGGGFVGSHLVDQLCAQGHTVTVIDDFSTGDRANLRQARERHPELAVHEADIVSPEAAEIVRATGPEVLMLLAAQMSVRVSMRDPLLDVRVNVEGLVRMLEAARTAGCRKVVFASSGGTIYRESPAGELPTPETRERIPRSFYGLTKSTAVEYLRLYWENHGLDYVAVALGNAYGPRQSPFGEAGVIAIFAERMLAGLPCEIAGDGHTTRDFVHVTDVADAFVRAMNRGHGLINIGTGRETSVLAVHDHLAKLTGHTPAPVHGPALPGEIRRVWLDVDRAKAELGWSAAIPLEVGMGSVVDWLRAKRVAR